MTSISVPAVPVAQPRQTDDVWHRVERLERRMDEFKRRLSELQEFFEKWGGTA